MAWTAPMTFITATALTAAQLNTHLRDNMNETEIAKAFTTGGMVVSTAANAVAERIPTGNENFATGNTTSTTYADLGGGGGAGPSVTVTTGDKAIVFYTCEMHNTVSNTFVLMSYSVSGGSIAAADDWAVGIKKNTGNRTFQQCGMINVHSGLTAGSNTFTAKYRVTAGEGWYNYRRMFVIPL